MFLIGKTQEKRTERVSFDPADGAIRYTDGACEVFIAFKPHEPNFFEMAVKVGASPGPEYQVPFVYLIPPTHLALLHGKHNHILYYYKLKSAPKIPQLRLDNIKIPAQSFSDELNLSQ